MCHHCGFKSNIKRKCSKNISSCEFQMYGPGVEKIYEGDLIASVCLGCIVNYSKHGLGNAYFNDKLVYSGEWLNDNFVQPAIRAYRSTGKRGGVKGKALVDKVEKRWLDMSNPQRIKATQKSMKNLGDFMDSEAGSQVSDWSKRAPTRF